MSDPTQASTLFVMVTQLTPAIEADWMDWHSTRHVGDVVEAAGFSGASKYRVVMGDPVDKPTYYTMYEAAGPDVLDAYLASDRRTVLRDDVQRLFGDKTSSTRFILHPLAS